MQAYIRVKKGMFSNKPIENMVFPLIHGLKIGTLGTYIKVNGEDVPGFPNRNFKVFVDHTDIQEATEQDFRVSLGREFTNPDPNTDARSDEDITKMFDQKFEDLAELVAAAQEGVVTSMIVAGNAGFGKTHAVETKLDELAVLDKIADRPPRYQVLKGTMSTVGMVEILYKNSDRGNVLVFDDCDTMLFDDEALNILKAALDTGKRRWISYAKDSRFLAENGVPNRFLFQGSVIFLTNLDFERMINRGNKKSPHFEALLSRSHYVDVYMSNQREMTLRIKSVIENHGLLDHYKFDKKEKAEVVEFFFRNIGNFRELSLRTVIKIADLRRASPKGWKRLVNTSCVKRGVLAK